MEDVIHTAHCRAHASRISHIADIELELGMVVALAHVILLFLVTAENSNLSYIRTQKPLEYRITKRAGTAGDN
ncbi:hypothetical protein D3C86_1802760 [compost metagenome]